MVQLESLTADDFFSQVYQMTNMDDMQLAELITKDCKQGTKSIHIKTKKTADQSKKVAKRGKK